MRISQLLMIVFAILALCLLGGVVTRAADPSDAMPDAMPDAPALVAKVCQFPLERLHPIDRRAVERYGWQLCQGSCGMVCAVHGGGWKWIPLDDAASGLKQADARGEARRATETEGPGRTTAEPACKGPLCRLRSWLRR